MFAPQGEEVANRQTGLTATNDGHNMAVVGAGDAAGTLVTHGLSKASRSRRSLSRSETD
jgi:hypothetical protein